MSPLPHPATRVARLALVDDGPRVRRLVALDCVDRAAGGLAFRNLANFPYKRCGALALLDGDAESLGLQGDEGEAGRLLRQTLDADRHVGASLRV